MIHTTHLTMAAAVRPMPKKYVNVHVMFRGLEQELSGLLEYAGGCYDGKVKIMDSVIEGWGLSMKDCAADLDVKAQRFIDREGLREAPSHEKAYATYA